MDDHDPIVPYHSTVLDRAQYRARPDQAGRQDGDQAGAEWILLGQVDLPDLPHLHREERDVEALVVVGPPVVPAKNAHGAAEAAEMLPPTVPEIREAVQQPLVETPPAVKRALPPAPVEQRQRGAWRSHRRTVVGFCCARFRDRREPVG